MYKIDNASFDVLISHMLTPRRFPQREAPSPAWDEAGKLATPHGMLAYWSAGTGPAVLLVHGWEGSHVDLDAFVEPLVRRGHRVLTFDHFAHGESDNATATLVDASRGVIAMSDRFGPFAGIVAHSVGGAASAMALQAGTQAARIALVSPPTRYEEYVRGFSEAVGVAHELMMAELAARGHDIDALDLPRIAETLAIPALLVHSADDRITPAAGTEVIAESWRGSRVLRVDGLGHKRILRDPAIVAAIVDFLSPHT